MLPREISRFLAAAFLVPVERASDARRCWRPIRWTECVAASPPQVPSRGWPEIRTLDCMVIFVFVAAEEEETASVLRRHNSRRQQQQPREQNSNKINLEAGRALRVLEASSRSTLESRRCRSLGLLFYACRIVDAKPRSTSPLMLATTTTTIARRRRRSKNKSAAGAHNDCVDGWQ